MSENEIGLREGRAQFGELVSRAEYAGTITYITRHGRRVAAIAPLSAIKEPTMTTEIASRIAGRTVHSYDLLDEVADAHDMSRSEAHDAIHAMLNQIIEIDGDGVILAERPIRPQLLEDNPNDLDIYYWLTISEETAQTIREAIAAQPAES